MPVDRIESCAVLVVLTVSSAGAGVGIGRQVSKCEKTCLCTVGRVQYGLFSPLFGFPPHF